MNCKTMYPIIKKAYTHKWYLVNEYYLYDIEDTYVHADTINKAKSLLLKNAQYNNITYNGVDDLTYLTIKIERNEPNDLVLFENKEVLRKNVNKIIRKQERKNKLDSILNDINITHCYIRKHSSYYRPNSSGYCELRTRAGVYTKQEAYSEAIFCDDIDIVPINNVEHNKMIQDEINELKSKLI